MTDVYQLPTPYLPPRLFLLVAVIWELMPSPDHPVVGRRLKLLPATSLTL